MNIEEFRVYCLSKPGVEESFPFDESTLVFKVGGKMFALTDLEADIFTVNLKCDPERAVKLREQWPHAIRPGWHMNKRHWNTVDFEAGPGDDLCREMIDHSYDLVVASLPKKVRASLRL